MGDQIVSTQKTRNHGIDLLRIVSMFFVVILHVLRQGGILAELPMLSVKYELAWFVEIACYCATNCYALISGYVGVNSNFKYTNIISLWLQVTFYSGSFALIAALISQEVSIRAVVNGLMPVSNGLYWYFTAYFCIFFFIPLFNKLLSVLNKKQMITAGISIILLFSVLPIVSDINIFQTNGGYSAIWIALLYVLGGIIRKTDIFNRIKFWTSFGLYFFFVFITWLDKFVVEFINQNVTNGETLRVHLLYYTSPTILFAAIILLNGFAKLKIRKIPAKIIAFLAPYSFGVYLVHTQKQVWDMLMAGGFIELSRCNVYLLIPMVLVAALGIYFAGTVIDAVRALLFKALHIKQLLGTIESKISGKIWD